MPTSQYANMPTSQYANMPVCQYARMLEGPATTAGPSKFSSKD